ncbi:MAG TPA: crotonyl-CoA carboxylase/reductase [Nannocystis sp.]|jgi:crotonyl-CoA carboxylase/reductase
MSDAQAASGEAFTALDASVPDTKVIHDGTARAWQRIPTPGHTPETMLAYVIRREREGDLRRAFQVERVATPRPGPGEVVVLVMAAGINYNGIWAALGRPRSVFDIHKHDLHIAGSDASGVVWEVGPGVKRWKPGDEVVIHGNMTCGECEACNGYDPMGCEKHRVCGYETPYGSFAQMMVVQGQQLLRKPPKLTWEEAASYGVGCFTAYRMFDRANLRTNETVLIWGAAGGLGCFAIQLARLQGAIPIAVVSNEEKAAVARLLGAEIVIDRTQFPDLAYHRDESPEQTTRRLAATKAFGRTIQGALAERQIRSDGVDVVFEHTGQETFPASVFLAKRMGRVVICGATSGYELTFDVRHLWMRQKSIIGCHGSNAQDSQRANELLCQGKIRPVLSKAYTVDEFVLAHEEMRLNLKIGTTACLMVAPRLGLRNLAETLAA